MSRNLGVRVGGEHDSLGLELRTKARVVLDDSVVNDRDAPVRRHVGVRIGVRRCAVSGPSGVPDRHRAGREGPVFQLLGENRELAGLLCHREPFAIHGHHRDARGVVTAILEPREARHDYVLRP